MFSPRAPSSSWRAGRASISISRSRDQHRTRPGAGGTTSRGLFGVWTFILWIGMTASHYGHPDMAINIDMQRFPRYSTVIYRSSTVPPLVLMAAPPPSLIFYLFCSATPFPAAAAAADRGRRICDDEGLVLLRGTRIDAGGGVCWRYQCPYYIGLSLGRLSDDVYDLGCACIYMIEGTTTQHGGETNRRVHQLRARRPTLYHPTTCAMSSTCAMSIDPHPSSSLSIHIHVPCRSIAARPIDHCRYRIRVRYQ